MSSSKKQKELRELVLKSVCEDLVEAEEKNGGRKPFGMVKRILDEMKADHPWVTRHTLRHALERYKFALKEKALQAERDTAGR